MRNTRVLSADCYVTQDISGPERLDANRAMMLRCLDLAEAYRPDFVVFPEICLHVGIAETPRAIEYAETAAGPTTELVAEKARALRSHVVLPMYERLGDKVYNSALLIDRRGEVVGSYRKYHATGYEIEDGVQPGEEVPVWETDRGPVGCAICFDLKFPVVGLELSRGKARLVFWPTMFHGGRRMAAWAMDYGFHLVRSWTGGGMVVDPIGNAIATPSPFLELSEPPGKVSWTFAEVNTDRKAYHLDFNQDKLPEIVSKYGPGVQICNCWPEGTFTLASTMTGTSVEDIEKEFALEDLRDYFDRAAEIRLSRLGRQA